MKDNWTEEQVTVVLYEYCRKPFGQFYGTNKFVKDLGDLLHRSPGAIVRKVGNLASFDPQMKARGVGGLAHTAKIDKQIWDKYYGNWDQLVMDAETIIARLRKRPLEQSLEINLQNLPPGLERIQEIKRRVNQDFFRRCVLVSYNNTCCISGINNPDLLEAGHIVDWKIDKINRTNPENGLCLNVLFHKAYDENLLGISPDYEVFISDEFLGEKLQNVEDSTRLFIKSFDKTKLHLPSRFLPDKDFLAIHFEKYRQKQF
ncbi:MAG: HNH endonuclease [Prevotella sp.]|nr:HNH endonuclease [Prevotella sp.]